MEQWEGAENRNYELVGEYTHWYRPGLYTYM